MIGITLLLLGLLNLDNKTELAWRRPGRNQPALTKRFLHKLKRVKLTGLGKMKKK